MENFISGLSVSRILKLKWFFSLLFIGFHASLCFLAAYFSYKNNKYKYYLFIILFYILIITLSSITYLLSSLANDVSLQFSFYYISMELSHYLQSSLAFISMIMIYELYTRLNNNSTQ